METQADTVEDNINVEQFILLQSDLHKLKLLSPTLAPYGTTNEDYNDDGETQSFAEFATTEILDHCRVPHSILVTSDNDDEEHIYSPGTTSKLHCPREGTGNISLVKSSREVHHIMWEYSR